jgi:hypothetical protein
MENRDRDEFLGVLAGAAEIFRQSLTPAQVELYWRALKAHPLDRVRDAIDAVMATERFMPPPAVLLEAIAKRRAVESGALPITAEQAWGIVTAAFQTVGRYRPFPTDTEGGPLLAKVVNAIGWNVLCNGENEAADRAHFFRMFDSIARQDADAERLGLPAISLRVPIPTDPKPEHPRLEAPVAGVPRLGDAMAGALTGDTPPASSPPVVPRPAAPMTDADIAARKAELRQQVAALRMDDGGTRVP